MTGNPKKLSVETFLATLGDDPELIRNNLNTMGIKGDVGDSTLCVIAVAINKLCDVDNDSVNVDSDDISYMQRGAYTTLVPNEAVERFITDFDAGDYPELEEED